MCPGVLTGLELGVLLQGQPSSLRCPRIIYTSDTMLELYVLSTLCVSRSPGGGAHCGLWHMAQGCKKRGQSTA